MSKKSFFIISMDIYEFDIIVSCGQSNSELLESLHDIEGGKTTIIDQFKYDIENPPHADGYCAVIKSGSALLRMMEYPTTAKDFGIMMHEVFHSISHPFRILGMKLSPNSEEAYAYAIGYVSTQIFAQLWKQ